jgi:hypothetical protein
VKPQRDAETPESRERASADPGPADTEPACAPPRKQRLAVLDKVLDSLPAARVVTFEEQEEQALLCRKSIMQFSTVERREAAFPEASALPCHAAVSCHASVQCATAYFGAGAVQRIEESSADRFAGFAVLRFDRLGCLAHVVWVTLLQTQQFDVQFWQVTTQAMLLCSHTDQGTWIAAPQGQGPAARRGCKDRDALACRRGRVHGSR